MPLFLVQAAASPTFPEQVQEPQEPPAEQQVPVPVFPAKSVAQADSATADPPATDCVVTD